MSVNIQVLCETKEQVLEIRQDFLKVLDDDFDFSESHIEQRDDEMWFASWPKKFKPSPYVDTLKKLSDQHKGVRFTLARVSLENPDFVIDYDNYVDGKFKDSVSVM